MVALRWSVRCRFRTLGGVVIRPRKVSSPVQPCPGPALFASASIQVPPSLRGGCGLRRIDATTRDSDFSRRPARLGGVHPHGRGVGTLPSHGPRPSCLPWAPFLSCRPRGPRRNPRRPWDDGGASRGGLRRSGSGPACRMWSFRGASDEVCLLCNPTVPTTSRLGFGLAASSRRSCFGREPSHSTGGTRTNVVTRFTGARRDDST